jgi:hypothetical protein
VHRLIDELKAEKIDSLVIDLRDNGGGHLSEATSLVGLFVERGPVVQLRESNGRIEVLDDPEPGAAWEGPLVVPSTVRAPPLRRYSRARSRTTSADSSSASRPMARVRYRTSTRSTATRLDRTPALASSR